MSWDNNLHHDHHHHHHHHQQQQQIPPLTIDLNHEFVEQLDHDHDHHFFINSSTTTATTSPPPAAPTYNYNYPSSSSSSSQPFFFSPLDHANPLANYDHFHHQDHQAKMISSAPEGGSCCSDEEMKLHMSGGGIDDQKQQNIPNQLGTSVKWMSSKMRIMRKMMTPPDHRTSSKQFYGNNLVHQDHDHKQHQPPKSPDDHEVDHSSSNVAVRVCSDCNTTKTPLWRSGPRGPKSLCNACGIRQRKARRAAMAAAAATAAGNGGSGAEITTAVMPSKSKLQCKKKRSSANGSTCATGQLKKKCKVVVQHSPPVLLSSDQEILKDSDTSSSSINNNNDNNSGTKRLCFEDLRVILSNNSAFQRAVFPQDEKEGAILLMALSYGLVQS